MKRFSRMLFIMLSVAGAGWAQDVLRKQVIVLAPGDSTTFLYTNKTTAFYYGETCRLNSTAFQGFNVLTQEYFEDYILQFDGHMLDRRTAEVFIYPDRLVRKFSPQQISEEVILLDSLNVLAIKVFSQAQGKLTFIPGFAGSRRPQDYELHWEQDFAMLHVGQRALMDASKGGKLPAWTAVASPTLQGGTTFVPYETNECVNLAKLFVAPTFVPGCLQVALRDSAWFYIIVGGDAKELMSVRNHVDGHLERLLRAREGRLEDVLERARIKTDRSELDRAINWAALSLDALIMNQQGKGIFAGLPWFNNYWGRDSFISLPGATLVTGNFAEAREILSSYANFQLRDSTDWRDGRIPNRVMPGEIIYNTADGTGWFVRAARDYLHYSGDLNFARRIYPVVQRAIDGALRHRTDAHGFITHRDAETWMDAVGPEGAWTPRGNRAVEIQALWFEKLLAGMDIARLAGFEARLADWQSAAVKLKNNFARQFWDFRRGALFDHLNADDSPDEQLRPNQIFALTVPSEPLLNPAQQQSILQLVINNLVYPHGVASLWLGDDHFHPYHHHEPIYVQDAAYHNGTVWTWLSGPVISAMVAAGAESLAFVLMEDAVTQILHRGSYGTQSELLDALPHPGENYPRLSGTATQAWNLAEFLRNWYQDFLGVRPAATRKSFTLLPALPPQVHEAAFTFAVGTSRVAARYQRNARGLEIAMRLHAGNEPLAFEVINRARQSTKWHGHLQGDRQVKILLRADGRDRAESSDLYVEKLKSDWHPIEKLGFAVPTLRPDLPALRGPTHAVLNAAETRFDTTGAVPVLRVTDVEGDDRGCTGTYVYPRHSVFEAGIFDLRRLEIWKNPEALVFRLHFKNLTQPGWHPAYGFQLTYCAIALDTDGNAGTGGRRIGRNANLEVPPVLGYERIIYLGGGFVVADAEGKILAEYLPQDVAQPLGDVEKKAITFAVPRSATSLSGTEIIGDLAQNAGVAVFVGGQDDHGGAGVGEFRSVRREASEWNGGGAASDGNSPNVYDELLYQANQEKME